MRHPRYELLIKIRDHTLTLALVGVHRRVWGYPTLDPDIDIEAYDSSEIYEGQVIFAVKLCHLIVIKLIRSSSVIGSVPIHTDSYPRLHQTRSTTLLPSHFLHWRWPGQL